MAGKQPDRLARMSDAGRRRRTVDGIILLDKPLGLSSNQALQRVKWLYRAQKAGHTGSLDPLATGMLPICLGQATKFSTFLLGAGKLYRVRIAFGRQTATGDGEGAVVATGPERVSKEVLEKALVRFRGEIMQVPPMYSALKHEGQRLYQIARRGQEVERPARPVTVHELVLEGYDPAGPVLRVGCSKGTYIRTLAEDIAREAGTVGHVAELRRLSVSPFAEAAMRTLPDLEAAAGEGEQALDACLLAPDVALVALPRVDLTAGEAARIGHGQAIAAASPAAGAPGLVRLYGETGRFLGVGERLADQAIVPSRLMAVPGADDRGGVGL